MAKNTERRARESALRSGWTVDGGADQVDPAEASVESDALDQQQVQSSAASGSAEGDAETEGPRPAQLGNLAVVLLGLTGGLFLLYAWIWLSWAQYYSAVNAAVVAGSGSIGGVLQQIVFWIAPLAPLLWFVTALVLERRNPKRLALLIDIGLIVLAPLPALFSNGAAL